MSSDNYKYRYMAIICDSIANIGCLEYYLPRQGANVGLIALRPQTGATNDAHAL